MKDKSYLKFVKSLNCVVCEAPADDAHHIIGNGQSAMGAKASDLYTFPLCRWHHSELHNKGWKAWEYEHNSQWMHVAQTMEKYIKGVKGVDDLEDLYGFPLFI